MATTKSIEIIDGIKLTANEIAAVRNIHQFEYIDGAPVERGLSTWSFAFTDGVAHFADLSVKAAKGVISSLSKKGLIVATGAGEDASVVLTSEGAAVWMELNQFTAEVEAPVAIAAAPVKSTGLTRKACLEALAAAGYTGPTSYLMPKLRSLVAEVVASAQIAA